MRTPCLSLKWVKLNGLLVSKVKRRLTSVMSVRKYIANVVIRLEPVKSKLLPSLYVRVRSPICVRDVCLEGGALRGVC